MLETSFLKVFWPLLRISFKSHICKQWQLLFFRWIFRLPGIWPVSFILIVRPIPISEVLQCKKTWTYFWRNRVFKVLLENKWGSDSFSLGKKVTFELGLASWLGISQAVKRLKGVPGPEKCVSRCLPEAVLFTSLHSVSLVNSWGHGSILSPRMTS